MSLNNLPAGDKFRREVRTEWGGINLNESAGDGELIEALNMSSREFPLLANLRLDRVGQDMHEPLVMPFCYDGELGGLTTVGATLTPYTLYDPKRPTTHRSVNITENDLYKVRYAQIGKKLYIFPCKQVYDFSTGKIADMEATWESDATHSLIVKDGTYTGVPATLNTLYSSGANWASKFSVNDGVTISGGHVNKTAVIREIDGDNLRFYENTFSEAESGGIFFDTTAALPAGNYKFTVGNQEKSFPASQEIPAGVRLNYITTPTPQVYYEAGDPPAAVAMPVSSTIPAGSTALEFSHYTVSRTIPDMDYVCTCENRLWGCKGDTIYASMLGYPMNFNVFDGLSTDSWAVETGTAGEFTGCCSFQGYPTFFKDDIVMRVFGDEPRNFALRKINIVGVTHDNDMSIVEIRGKLYYSSSIGIVEWNGGDYPNIISSALALDVNALVKDPINGPDSVAGTDGLRYFIDLTYTRPDGQYKPMLLVYDTRFGTWHEMDRYDAFHRVGFASGGSKYWMIQYRLITEAQQLVEIADLFELSNPRALLAYAPDWRVTFADSTRAYKTALTGSESKKGVLRLLIRCRLAGTMKVWLAYDGGDFEEAAAFGGEDGMEKGSRVVPLVLRRCDFWQLRLTGTGDAVIYSIAVERYAGEWQQA